MAQVITLKTNGTLQHTLTALKGIHHNVPKGTREGIRRWGNTLATDMKNSARIAVSLGGSLPIKPMSGGNSLLNKGIRWEQRKKSNVGHLFMRQYGVFLDSMSPHVMPITRNTPMRLRWARQARTNYIRRKAQRLNTNTGDGTFKSDVAFVRVKPHPFIKAGWRIARPKLPIMLKQEVSKSVRTSTR